MDLPLLLASLHKLITAERVLFEAVSQRVVCVGTNRSWLQNINYQRGEQLHIRALTPRSLAADQRCSVLSYETHEHGAALTSLMDLTVFFMDLF